MLITASLTNGVCDVPCPSQAWAAPQQCGRTESLSDLDTAYPDDAGHLIAEPLVPHSCELLWLSYDVGAGTRVVAISRCAMLRCFTAATQRSEPSCMY